MAIEKFAQAVWTGSLKDGGGMITTQSGALAGLPYSYATRFEDKAGSNPEELIGAAHAACYSMFLSALMSGAGVTGIAIETRSTVSLDPTAEGGPTVTGAHLVTTVKADTDAAAIADFAQKAKDGCPISKLLNTKVTLEVKQA